MKWDLLEIFSISILVISVCFLVKHASHLQMEQAKYQGAYNRCEDVVDTATRIMTKRERWKLTARIEEMNK